MKLTPIVHKLPACLQLLFLDAFWWGVDAGGLRLSMLAAHQITRKIIIYT